MTSITEGVLAAAVALLAVAYFDDLFGRHSDVQVGGSGGSGGTSMAATSGSESLAATLAQAQAASLRPPPLPPL